MACDEPYRPEEVFNLTKNESQINISIKTVHCPAYV